MSLVFGMVSSLFWLRPWAFFVGGWLDVFHYLRAIWWLRNWPRSGFFLLSASACCANAFNVYHVYTPTHYGTPSAVYYRHLPRGRHGEAPYGTALHGTPRHCTALHRHCTAPRPFLCHALPRKLCIHHHVFRPPKLLGVPGGSITLRTDRC